MEEILKPITKAEVVKTPGIKVSIYFTKWAHQFIREIAKKAEPAGLSPAYWMRFGYEIARARAERGEEL
jgi:peroxiredoxin family protein